MQSARKNSRPFAYAMCFAFGKMGKVRQGKREAGKVPKKGGGEDAMLLASLEAAAAAAKETNLSFFGFLQLLLLR